MKLPDSNNKASHWYHQLRFWSTKPCRGCKKSLDTTDEAQRLCTKCLEEMLENIAVRLDPTYDKTVMNEWPAVLSVLWPKWNWRKFQ